MSAQPSAAAARIGGVHFVPFRAHGDSRGYFFESFRRSWVPEARDMVQGNCSFSKAGVLRGLHYHLKQADFWVVPSGSVRAVLYDARTGSPTRGASEVHLLGGAGDSLGGLYIPKGVAHGFLALEDSLMTYLVDEYYDNSDEQGIRWNDPALGVDWGAGAPIISDRDQQNRRLAEIPAEELPR